MRLDHLLSREKAKMGNIGADSRSIGAKEPEGTKGTEGERRRRKSDRDRELNSQREGQQKGNDSVTGDSLLENLKTSCKRKLNSVSSSGLAQPAP